MSMCGQTDYSRQNGISKIRAGFRGMSVDGEASDKTRYPMVCRFDPEKHENTILA